MKKTSVWRRKLIVEKKTFLLAITFPSGREGIFRAPLSIFYTFANLKNHKKTSIINNQTKILKHINLLKKLLDWSLRWIFERDYSWKVWERNFDMNNFHFMNPNRCTYVTRYLSIRSLVFSDTLQLVRALAT